MGDLLNPPFVGGLQLQDREHAYAGGRNHLANVHE